MPFGTPILRNFNEADSNSPANGFTDLNSTSRIVSNQYAANASLSLAIATGLGAFGPAHLEFYATIATKPTTGNIASIVAYQDIASAATIDGYEARLTVLSGTDTWQLFRADDGVGTQLGSTILLEATNGDGLGIRIVTGLGGQQVISLWRRSGGVWNCLVSVIDNTHTSAKYIGLILSDTTARLDDLGGGNLTATDVYTSDTDLVSLWEMEEVSGSRADSIGSNTLTDNATVASSTDVKKGSRSADFERSTSEYLDISDASQNGLGITGPLSIVLWAKLESLVGAVLSLVAKHQNSAGAHGYALQLNSSQQLVGRLSGDGSSDTTATSTLALGIARWYHLALVYTGTALELYIDGSQVLSVAYSSGIFNNAQPFTIGRSTGATDYFDGLIDEAGIFNRALSEAEVLGIFAEGIQTSLFISLNTLTIASSLQDLVVTSQVSILMDSLTLVSSPEDLTVLPGGISVSLNTLSLASSVEDLEVTTLTLILLNTLSLSSSVEDLTVLHGAISVLLDTLSLLSSVEDLTAESSIPLDTLILISTIQDLTVVPGTVPISLDTLSLISSVEDLEITTGSIILLDTLILVSELLDLSINSGAISVLLDVLTLTSTLEDISILTGVEISLDTLSLASSIEDLTVVPGAIALLLDTLTLNSQVQDIGINAPISIPLDTLNLSASLEDLIVAVGALNVPLSTLILLSVVQDLTVVPGSVQVPLDTLNLSSELLDLSIFTGTSITLDSLILLSSVQDMSVIPGAVAVQLDTLTLASSVLDLSIAEGALLQYLFKGMFRGMAKGMR